MGRLRVLKTRLYNIGWRRKVAATSEGAGLKPGPYTGREGVGVEALFVEEEDAGAEGEEHDGEASGDAEAGGDGGGTVVAAANDDVARDDNQEFQDAALEQPGCAPKHPEIGSLVKESFPKILAANGESQGPDHPGREKR